MCGFVGILSSNKEFQFSEIRNAIKSIEHRGPDDCGTWLDTVEKDSYFLKIGFGHARLSIIDLSEHGKQPMASSNGMVIIHNGEIYNYLEIRQELETLGYAFKSNTDTEVILAAYHQWQEACVKRFIGMWSFAIWDGVKLFMSRDRLGQKPLYYYFNKAKGFLAFASEIKAFRSISDVPWRPNERTVYRFLAFAEMEGEGNTFYDEIREFPRGNYLIYEPKVNCLEFSTYWNLPEEKIDISEKDAIDKTYELLSDSIRLRLRSDVPVGLSLSGGLDSTLLLSLINRISNRNIDVFSTRYNERNYDETNYTDIAINNLNCIPHSITSDFSHFKNDFEKIIYHLDQPSKLPGPFSQWRVAELASKKVKVLIDGQGADELAGGYIYFIPPSWWQSSLWQKIRYSPDLVNTILANRHIFNIYPFLLILERVMGKVQANQSLPLTRELASQFVDEKPVWIKNIPLYQMLRKSITETSLPALLRYGDRDNMAFGLENRSPFLDHRLVEHISALPAHMKIRGGTTKWIIRKVAEDKVPQSILKRRMKMGFPTPFGDWLRNELFETAQGWFKEYSNIPLFREWIDIDSVFSIFDEHTSSGKVDHHALLWRVLSVGAWLKTSGVN